jgi:integrase/recombinase XerD
MFLKFAVKDFKDDREFKNLSENMINAYMFTLEKFYEFCSEQEIINVEDVSASTIKIFTLPVEVRICVNQCKDFRLLFK